MSSQATLTRLKTNRQQPPKIARILAVLYDGDSLHRFQAIQIGDTALNSTISALANEHGLHFERASIKLANRFGPPAKVTNYRLAPTCRSKAACLLKHWGVEV